MNDRLDELRPRDVVLVSPSPDEFDRVWGRARRQRFARMTLAASVVAAVVAGGVVGATTLAGSNLGEQKIRPATSGLPTPRVPTKQMVNPTPPNVPPDTPASVVHGAFAIASDGTAWAVGESRCRGQGLSSCVGLVERSTDAGRSWRIVHMLPKFDDNNERLAIVAASPRDIWIETDGLTGLYVTHDAGRSWQRVHVTGRIIALHGADGDVWAITCLRSNCQVQHGAGSSTSLTATARQPRFANAATDPPLGLTVTSRGTGFVDWTVGPSAYLASTANAGRTWTTHRLPCTSANSFAPALDAAPSGRLWLICAAEPGAGQQPKDLYESTDSGTTWEKEPILESSGYATNVVAVGDQVAWRYGGRAPIYRTTDGGRSWQVLLTNVFGDPAGGASPSGFTATSSGEAIAEWQLGVLYVTTDGGATWHRTKLVG